ncbi:hypothetical protein ACQKFO_21530 [Rossellomorea sp. NPDC071047]|uniref:hypothetical protein n=1 Tax=Rossellomorea sp. NPDC071047 TaxID=3390675 RepID=UPI003D07DC7E
MKAVQTVVMDLDRIQVEVKTTKGMTQEEILELAKKEVINKLSEAFPRFSYSITEGRTMSLEEAKPGRIVKSKLSGELAIIFAVKPSTKFPVYVKSSRESYRALPTAFELVTDPKVINDVMFGKQFDFMWHEGDTGYFLNKNTVIPVVVGTTTRGKTKVIALDVNSEGAYYSLSESSMNRIYESKEDAQKHLI